MESVSLSPALATGAIQDSTSLQLINKTLTNQQEMAGKLSSGGSAPAISGKGERVDVTV